MKIQSFKSLNESPIEHSISDLSYSDDDASLLSMMIDWSQQYLLSLLFGTSNVYVKFCSSWVLRFWVRIGTESRLVSDLRMLFR